MKKRISLALALVLLFALCACGAPAAKKAVAGTWEGAMDMTDSLSAEMGELAQYLPEAKVTVRLEMAEDGTFTLVVDGSSMLPAMREAVRAYLENYCAQAGLNLADMAAASGMSVDELIDAAMADVDTEELTNSSTGTYTDDNGTLTLQFDGGIAREGTWVEDTLTLPVEQLGDITFTRK